MKIRPPENHQLLLDGFEDIDPIKLYDWLYENREQIGAQAHRWKTADGGGINMALSCLVEFRTQADFVRGRRAIQLAYQQGVFKID